MGIVGGIRKLLRKQPDPVTVLPKSPQPSASRPTTPPPSFSPLRATDLTPPVKITDTPQTIELNSGEERLLSVQGASYMLGLQKNGTAYIVNTDTLTRKMPFIFDVNDSVFTDLAIRVEQKNIFNGVATFEVRNLLEVSWRPNVPLVVERRGDAVQTKIGFGKYVIARSRSAGDDYYKITFLDRHQSVYLAARYGETVGIEAIIQIKAVDTTRGVGVSIEEALASVLDAPTEYRPEIPLVLAPAAIDEIKGKALIFRVVDAWTDIRNDIRSQMQSGAIPELLLEIDVESLDLLYLNEPSRYNVQVTLDVDSGRLMPNSLWFHSSIAHLRPYLSQAVEIFNQRINNFVAEQATVIVNR